MPFLDLAGFRARYPQFSKNADAQVQAVLDEAELEIDEDVWGDKTGTGHGLLTAWKLTAEAFGRDTKANVPSPYQVEYERLVRIVGGAYRVVLD